MDQIKIGKFIAQKRKEKHMTQAQLAEKLNITDRAVSKWETGKGMPDSSIMLDLCDELSISVNELLSGEDIIMENYSDKSETLLLELAGQEEQKNKSLMLAMWTLLFTSLAGMLVIVLLIANFIPDGSLQTALILITAACSLVPMFISLKLEVNAGYYECRNCHHRFVPGYRDVLWAMHIGTTRHLKCPECGKRSWCKKVLTAAKEEKK